MAHSSTGVKHENYTKFLIASEAVHQGVDPKLAIAVATVESGLNNRAVGSKGERGVFQLMPKLHKQKALVEEQENIKAGVSELKTWAAKCPVKESFTFVICFNGGFRHPKYPNKHPYYLKVMEAMR